MPLAQAQSNDPSEIDNLIQLATVPTYDCPDDEYIPRVEEALESASLTLAQKYGLQTRMTHWQICKGRQEEAKNTLLSIVNDGKADKNAAYYANALYQLGFVYDVQENEERCPIYQRAKDRAKDKFNDVYLSANMGLITVCNPQNDDGVKLGKLYALLEDYSQKGDNAALAHIHNSLGLLYGGLGQQALAAEQFYKSFELGLGSYNGSNRLATLISVISAYLAGGYFDDAKRTIDEFREVNYQVNTPQSNVWLHFAEAGYHYRTGNIEELKNSLARWSVYLPQINSVMYSGLHRWYSAVVCLAEQDEACLKLFLEAEQQAPSGYRSIVNRNKDYLKFIVEIHLFFGDLERIKSSFEHYSNVLTNQVIERQKSGKVLGVANLHAQVMSLESRLNQERQKQRNVIIAVVVCIIVLCGFGFYLFRVRRRSSDAIDATTQLLGRSLALAKIRKVPSPSQGKTNALALFDLGRFKDVNQLAGEIALDKIAQTLMQVTRERDILGRYADEQFVVCLTNIEEDTANSFIERIRVALEIAVLGGIQGEAVSLRSSMSIYISTEMFEDLDDLLADMQRSLGNQNP